MTLKASFPVDRVKKMENKSQDSTGLLRSKAAVTDIQVAAGVGHTVSFCHHPWLPFFLLVLSH